ncbi:hypothetical protein [uncultured Hymenobacter sp.]|uniref:hypothetical protein n=1 Tax=uncultured Hymenobacter sp. TaxID=170016 RepID=UPI0035CC9EDC
MRYESATDFLTGDVKTSGPESSGYASNRAKQSKLFLRLVFNLKTYLAALLPLFNFTDLNSMKPPDPLFFRLMSTWRRSDNVFANPCLRKLNSSSTNYKGWRVVFSPTNLQLDREALERNGYPFSALGRN